MPLWRRQRASVRRLANVLADGNLETTAVLDDEGVLYNRETTWKFEDHMRDFERAI